MCFPLRYRRVGRWENLGFPVVRTGDFGGGYYVTFDVYKIHGSVRRMDRIGVSEKKKITINKS